ncbi:DUF4270 domain-containing protein [Flavobacterium crocinum]|uniref:DUF4270 domain-containing protein n=1 Tax=Flavobacterium crocinum TaxID=2183896 RepID=A0A2S1YH88_9FLAO|nr:DUF4270 domain-containing protein [Flavobacterium crocinum]AWK03443.1 DUF4270 domain-containing protein [Flavobacterium crocinum]
MYNTSFIKKILLALIVVFLYSCDKDFNAIGDGLVGDDHFGLEPEEYSVLAFNQEITPVASNNLPTNALGIFDNPLFGTTTANFVTQVALASYAPTIGESPVIQSVYLAIPYFVKNKVTATDGTSTYELDSIYGGQGSNFKIKLSVYESNMQMRNSYFSGGNQLPQYYYTDQDNAFSSVKGSLRLNDSIGSNGVNVDDQFYFSAAERTDSIVTDGKKTASRIAPQMYLKLNKQFFQDKILKAATSKLASEDVFQDYFRGLYFMVEKSGSSPSNMALMDFTKGVITIKYKAKTASTTDGDATEDKEIVLNLKSLVTGGVVSTNSFLQDVRNADYQNAIATANINTTEGDERLYLKGGQGSLAVIRLNDFASQLDDIRKTNWKVNEANLVFHVDTDKMGTTRRPQRVYLYDLTNNTVLLDYSADDTAPYGGGLITVDSKKGTYYKIRITNHIRNLIKDATAKNIDLGLSVSLSGSVIASNPLKNKNSIISQAPRTSVMSPLGTVLYGGKTSAGDKRLKLEVYYTKPN